MDATNVVEEAILAVDVYGGWAEIERDRRVQRGNAGNRLKVLTIERGVAEQSRVRGLE